MSSDLTPDVIVELDDEAFKNLVDDDLRRASPNERARSTITPATSAALRSPVVVDRWYAQLTRSAKSVDGQLAAREAEYGAKRAALKAEILAAEQRLAEAHRAVEQDGNVTEAERALNELRQEAEKMTANHLRAKAGTLRFKSGLDECVIEARLYRDQTRAGQYESIVADERNYYAHRVMVLEQTIRDHRFALEADDAEPSPYDEILWQVLDPIVPD